MNVFRVAKKYLLWFALPWAPLAVAGAVVLAGDMREDSALGFLRGLVVLVSALVYAPALLQLGLPHGSLLDLVPAAVVYSVTGLGLGFVYNRVRSARGTDGEPLHPT